MLRYGTGRDGSSSDTAEAAGSDDPLARLVLELFPAARTKGGWDGWAAIQRDACPAVDLLAQTRKAAAWCASNGAKGQKRDIKAFLGRWFAKAQDDAARVAAPGPASRPAQGRFIDPADVRDADGLTEADRLYGVRR